MRFIAAFSSVLVLIACSGCARTSIDSKPVAEATLPINRIALIFHSSQTFTPRSPTSGANSAYASIGVNKAYENQTLITQAVRSQFPVAFRAQGIDMEVYMDPSDKDRYALDANKQRHVMHLKPVGANYRSYGGGTSLFMEAQLLELRPSRVLWTGNISVVRPGLAKIDDEWAAAFAEKIVQQLKEDGIIGKSGTRKPVAASSPDAGVKREPGDRNAEISSQIGQSSTAAGVKQPNVAPGNPVALDDVDAVPLLGPRGRQGYRDWLTKKAPRAFVISANGSWVATWGNPPNSTEPADAAERAMARCNKRALLKCRLYAVDNRVVWTSE